MRSAEAGCGSGINPTVCGIHQAYWKIWEANNSLKIKYMETNLTITSANKEGEASGVNFDFKNLRMTQREDGRVMHITGDIYNKASGVYLGAFNYNLYGGMSVNTESVESFIPASGEILSSLIPTLEQVQES
jgi:hypothetical protein